MLLKKNKKTEESAFTFSNEKGIPFITKTEIKNDMPEREEMQKASNKNLENIPVTGEDLAFITDGQIQRLNFLSDLKEKAKSKPRSCKSFIDYFDKK